MAMRLPWEAVAVIAYSRLLENLIAVRPHLEFWTELEFLLKIWSSGAYWDQ
jgi:hypothetical protein